MDLQQLKRITAALLFLLVVGTAGYVVKVRTTSYIDQKEQAFNEKVTLLEGQILGLQQAVAKLSGENVQTALSLRELQNRKNVIAKSQDELLTEAVAKVSPAVVSIVVAKDVPKLEIEYVNPFGDDPFFKDFNFRVPVYRQKGVERQKIGAGTGFLVTKDGYILTNRHVVADSAAVYTVLLSDGKQLAGKVVFRDPKNDLALVKIEGGPFKTVTLGNSNELKLGQTVIAIGNALGEYNNSVSVGIISGLDRSLEAHDGTRLVKLVGVLQTDAAINPGNSGGPLINMVGEVIGVNVATVIGSSNISFSIPIHTAKNLIGSIVPL